MKPHINSCCQKCLIYLDYKTNNEYQCNNRECECHTSSETPEGWEESFDKEISEEAYYTNGPTGVSRGAVKLFISQLIEREREKTAGELKGIMNKCKTERGLGTALANFIRGLTDNKK